MVKVRIINTDGVIVGHKRLLPGEVHEVQGAALVAAVATYGAEAFQVLGGQPSTATSEPHVGSGEPDDDATSDAGGATASDQNDTPTSAEPHSPAKQVRQRR